jgi:hypothetical protein
MDTWIDILAADRASIFNGVGSVPCTLTNLSGTTQELRCIGDFVGAVLNPISGVYEMNDSSECCINYRDVYLGEIKANWQLSFLQPGTNELINFKVDNVMVDRTLGLYKLKISILKPGGENLTTAIKKLRSNRPVV